MMPEDDTALAVTDTGGHIAYDERAPARRGRYSPGASVPAKSFRTAPLEDPGAAR
jgi:hypothetical protein